MLDKRKMLIDEICKKGRLEEYRKTIGQILLQIENENCRISCCDVCETSSIEQSMNGSEKPHIRIGFKIPKENPKHIIWDILHEFGHHLSGLPNGNEKTVNRELLAWNIGLEQLKLCPELVKYVDDYKVYQRYCLKTYKNKATSA